MGQRRRKTLPELGEHQVFGNEEAAQLRADVDEMRAQMADVVGRVNAQFTSIAAHAEISREQIDLARDEARVDMERSRETVIGLIERLREEVADGAIRVRGTAPGPSGAAINERFDALEAAVGDLADRLDTCLDRQRRMADTMAAFIDTILAEQRGEPVAGLSLV